MTPLEYYSKRKEDSRQELATLIAQANQLIGDTHNSLNTHTNQVSNMGNIKMLSQQLQQLTSRIELEKQKGDMLESICLTLTISKVNLNFFTLNEEQFLVNGYVQVIDICPNKIMIMNEEGKFHFELNVEATRIALMNSAIFPDDYIAGDAIVCDGSMF